MNERRWVKLEEHWSIVIVLIAIAAAGHFSWNLTDIITYTFYPLTYISIAYLGYKGGQRLGFVAGLAAGLTTTLIALIFSSTELRWDKLVWAGDRLQLTGDPALSLHGYSVEYAFVLAVFGWVVGRLFDGVDKYLIQHSLSFEDLLPVKKRMSYIAWLNECVAQWSQRWHKEDKTGESGLVSDRGRSAVKVGNILPLVLVAYILNFFATWRFDSFELRLFPELSAEVLLLVVAFYVGSRLTIIASWWVWLLNLGTFLPGGLSTFLYEFGFDSRVLSLSMQSPAEVLGLSILLWWIGQVGELYRDSSRWPKVKLLFVNLVDHELSRRPPSDAIVVIFFLLSIGTYITFYQQILHIKPYLFLAVTATIYAFFYEQRAVSNRVVLVTLLFSLLAVQWDYRSEGFSVVVATVWQDALTITLLGILPLLASRLQLRELNHCRLITFGLMSALFIRDFVLDGTGQTWLPMNVSAPSSFGPRALDLVLALLIYEAAARILRWFAMRIKRVE